MSDLHDVSPKAVFRMACRLAWRDGSLSTRERRMLGRVAKCLKIPEQDAAQTIEAARSGSSAGSAYGEAERDEVFRKALHLAKADGVITRSERALLHALGVALGMRAAAIEAQLPSVAETRPTRRGEGGSFWVMLFFTALLSFGSWTGLQAVWTANAKKAEARTFVETTGTMGESEIQEVHIPSGTTSGGRAITRTRYHLSVEYRYLYDGRAFRGRRHNVHRKVAAFETREDAEAEQGFLRPGSAVPVFVDPDNPVFAVLDPDAEETRNKDSFFLFLFFWILTPFSAYETWRLWRRG